MRTLGFLISTKENEKRRALLPEHVALIKNKKYLYFEKGYGSVVGYSDEDYKRQGANIAAREDILKKDIICDPKMGENKYLSELNEGQIIFGWIHAVQNSKTTDIMVKRKLTAIAWEEMYKMGRHVFWRNNELAGEAGVLHAFTLYGKLPCECSVALIGRGNVSRGAYKILSSLGAKITVYDRKTEGLIREEIGKYDVIVNGVLWDVYRKDHIIYKEDLLKMKKNSLIIDISCDRNGAIETSIPTTIENPIYTVNGVLHYAVDHTPTLFSHSASKFIGDQLVKYIDCIIEEKEEKNETLKNAVIIKNGNIIDKKIIDYQQKIA